eukprot:1182404-Lingulodinium_polyedra.AAC.1
MALCWIPVTCLAASSGQTISPGLDSFVGIIPLGLRTEGRVWSAHRSTDVDGQRTQTWLARICSHRNFSISTLPAA